MAFTWERKIPKLCSLTFSETPPVFPGDFQMQIHGGYIHNSELEGVKEHSRYLLVYLIKLFRVALGQYLAEQDSTLLNNS